MATELAKAYVQIIPSATGIKAQLEDILGDEVGGAGDSAGETLGSRLVSTAKKIIAAAGFGEALKSALTEGAALEQSIGGIETLFKDSADTVKQYAENAYQTAGLSANEYMETVTSFSASLLSSMGNDTDAAAEKANMALTDMSDNANKMGTSMEDIQNAYQGFAKQNYTMLDNLKLGYGGTQSEMKRLLEDANEINAAQGIITDYSIDSFADIVDAIHVVQSEMGITGTTASEAATTFSGSLASMQAAAKNVLGYLALGEDIQPSLDALSSTVYTFLVGNMIPMVGNVLSGLPQVVLSLGGDLFSAVSTLLPQATSAGVEIINSIASGLASGIPSFLAQALPMLTQFSGSLRENAGQLVDAGLNLIMQLAAGLIASLPTLIENVPLIVTNIAGIINDNAPKLLTTAGNLLVMLGRGLIAAIPTLIANIPQIITAITAVFQAFNWINLGKNIMTMLKNGITAMKSALKQAGTDVLNNIYNAIKSLPTKLLALGKSGGSGLASGIKGMLSAVKSAAGNLLSGVVSAVMSMPSKLLSIGKSAVTKMKSVFKISEWKNIGKNIINGIISGITGMVGKLYSSIKSALSGLVGKAKSALGIASPSKVFAKQVGAFIPPGIGEGLEAAMPDLLRDTQSAMGDLVDAASEPVTVAAAVGAAVTGSSAYTSSATPSNAAITETLSAEASQLYELLQTYLPQLANMQMVTDTGALVGEITTKMDTALGKAQNYRGRGN